MVEVKRGEWGGWQWSVRVGEKFIGAGTAPTDSMAWDGAQDCLDEYVRGLQGPCV